MTRCLLLPLTLLIFLIPCLATDGVLKRNSNLRSDPSSNNAEIELLTKGTNLHLIADSPTNGYFHVKSPDGQEGWIWGRNLEIIESPPEDEAGVDGLTSEHTSAEAAAVNPQWNMPRPVPHETSFSGDEGPCEGTGQGGDPNVNELKNRDDVPTGYHNVKWKAVADLPFPDAPTHRTNWTQGQLAEIAPFEGIPISTTGFLVAFKPQNSGSGEACNCHFHHAANVDVHMALAGEPGQGEETSVVIETTPRLRAQHPNWTKANLDAWLDGNDPVRISGWLMLDPEHKAHLGTFRTTLWEIHPITKIEAWKNGTWVDLDSLP